MLYSLLADLVVALHFVFVAFVLFGGFLVRRWPLASWLHLPSVLWAVLIEVVSLESPLTPVEKWLRAEAGQPGYEGGFVERYLLPVLGVDQPTNEGKLLLGVVIVLVNVAVYATVLRRRPLR